MFKRWLVIIGIVLFGYWQIGSIFRDSFYRTHDGLYHVARIDEFFEMLKIGQVPVRWGLNLKLGWGVPIFSYVYPGTYYLTSIFKALGADGALSMRLLVLSSYVIGGIGVYLIAEKKLGKSKAMAVSIIYLLVPYQLVDIMVRGALGETVALGLMPLVWWSFWQGKWKWHQPVLLALLLLCHNFLGFLFLGFLIAWGLINRQTEKFRWINILLALGFSAFFWIPAIMEKGWLQSGQGGSLTFDYRDHFSTLKQVIYSKWGYWYSDPGVATDGMTFQVGFTSWLIFGLASVMIFFKKYQKDLIWLVVFFGLTVLMMLPYSDSIWKIFSPIQMIQFPWRWLFLTTFLTPIILIKILELEKSKWGILLIVGLLVIAWINTRNYKTPMHWYNETEYAELLRSTRDGTTTTAEGEVLPKWYPEKQERVDGIIKVKAKNNSFELEINKDRVVVGRSYFPTWKLVDKNGLRKSIEPDKSGLISANDLEAGNYKLILGYSNWQKIAIWISLISIVGWGFGGITSRNRSNKR